MKTRTCVAGTFLLSLAMLAGCSSEPATTNDRKTLVDEGKLMLAQMKSTDPTLVMFLDAAQGYAIFPNVGKGGLIAGGAHGFGSVYEGDELIGYSELSQASIGGQIGGQSYAELVVFESKPALQRFNSGKISFDANLSAIALTAGTAKTTHFTNGIAVFKHPIGGLMAEATIAGQQFVFTPK